MKVKEVYRRWKLNLNLPWLFLKGHKSLCVIVFVFVYASSLSLSFSMSLSWYGQVRTKNKQWPCKCFREPLCCLNWRNMVRGVTFAFPTYSGCPVMDFQHSSSPMHPPSPCSAFINNRTPNTTPLFLNMKPISRLVPYGLLSPQGQDRDKIENSIFETFYLDCFPPQANPQVWETITLSSQFSQDP